jgi:hypothetical protein
MYLLGDSRSVSIGIYQRNVSSRRYYKSIIVRNISEECIFCEYIFTNLLAEFTNLYSASYKKYIFSNILAEFTNVSSASYKKYIFRNILAEFTNVSSVRYKKYIFRNILAE